MKTIFGILFVLSVINFAMPEAFYTVVEVKPTVAKVSKNKIIVKKKIKKLEEITETPMEITSEYRQYLHDDQTVNNDFTISNSKQSVNDSDSF